MKKKSIDDTIDEIIVQHLDRTNATSTDYIDLDKYEMCRVALKRTFAKRAMKRSESAGLRKSQVD